MQPYYGMDFHQTITEGLRLPAATTETIIDTMIRRWGEIEAELAREGLHDVIITTGVPEADGYRLFIGFQLDAPPTEDEMEMLNKKIFDAATQLAVMPWCENLFVNGELTIISAMEGSDIMQQYCRYGW